MLSLNWESSNRRPLPRSVKPPGLVTRGGFRSSGVNVSSLDSEVKRLSPAYTPEAPSLALEPCSGPHGLPPGVRSAGRPNPDPPEALGPNSSQDPSGAFRGVWPHLASNPSACEPWSDPGAFYHASGNSPWPHLSLYHRIRAQSFNRKALRPLLTLWVERGFPGDGQVVDPALTSTSWSTSDSRPKGRIRLRPRKPEGWRKGRRREQRSQGMRCPL